MAFLASGERRAGERSAAMLAANGLNFRTPNPKNSSFSPLRRGEGRDLGGRRSNVKATGGPALDTCSPLAARRLELHEQCVMRGRTLLGRAATGVVVER